MTPPRAAGPGPRTVALHRVRSILAAGLLTLSVAACASSATGPSGGPASPPPTLGPAGPGASSGPSSSTGTPPVGGSGPAGNPASPDASQPRWPGTTVLAVIALGAADGEIQKAGDDLQAAAASRDLKAMWGAADGLARMIDALMPNLDRLDVYEGTKPVEALYRKAFPEISAGAKQLRDAITASDANGIVAGSQAIAQGLADYGPIREQIAALVEQAILQQRLLLE